MNARDRRSSASRRWLLLAAVLRAVGGWSAACSRSPSSSSRARRRSPREMVAVTRRRSAPRRGRRSGSRWSASRIVDRRRRAARLPDRQLVAPGLRGAVPADDRLQRGAEGGVRADPRRLVRHRRSGPAILTAFLISFFPITVNIATGLATLEPELEDVLRVLGAKRWDVLVKVGLPRSMPYFYGSLKVAITLAFVGTVLAEMTAGDSGIGYLMQLGRLAACACRWPSPGWSSSARWRWRCTSCSRGSRSAPRGGRIAGRRRRRLERHRARCG